MSPETEKDMIIEYSRKATCKDCIYCGYYYPLKKMELNQEFAGINVS
jgi:hypothetical protein